MLFNTSHLVDNKGYFFLQQNVLFLVIVVKGLLPGLSTNMCLFHNPSLDKKFPDAFKGQMRHQNDIGLKCHLSKKTDPEPVLFSTTKYIAYRNDPEFFGTRVGCHVSAVEWV